MFTGDVSEQHFTKLHFKYNQRVSNMSARYFIDIGIVIHQVCKLFTTMMLTKKPVRSIKSVVPFFILETTPTRGVLAYN